MTVVSVLTRAWDVIEGDALLDGARIVAVRRDPVRRWVRLTDSAGEVGWYREAHQVVLAARLLDRRGNRLGRYLHRVALRRGRPRRAPRA